MDCSRYVRWLYPMKFYGSEVLESDWWTLEAFSYMGIRGWDLVLASVNIIKWKTGSRWSTPNAKCTCQPFLFLYDHFHEKGLLKIIRKSFENHWSISNFIPREFKKFEFQDNDSIIRFVFKNGSENDFIFFIFRLIFEDEFNDRVEILKFKIFRFYGNKVWVVPLERFQWKPSMLSGETFCVCTQWKYFVFNRQLLRLNINYLCLKYGVWGLAHIIWEKGFEFLMDFKGP